MAKKKDPPKREYVDQLAKIFKCPAEYFYSSGESNLHLEIIYNKRLSDIVGYKLLADLINDNKEFREMYKIPEVLIELFADEKTVETLRITGKELQAILLMADEYGERLNKKWFIKTLNEVRSILSSRIYEEYEKYTKSK